MLLKVIKVENVWFVAIGFWIMDSNVKIMHLMVVMIYQCCVTI